MAKRVKAPARPSTVQTHEQLLAAITRAGEIDRLAKANDAAAEAAVTKTLETLAQKQKPLADEAKLLAKDIQAYAEANRATLLPEDRKTVDLIVGELGWRADPASVKLVGSVADAVAALQSANLTQFIRIDESVNKEALLAFRRTYLTPCDDEEINRITRSAWADLIVCGAVRFIDDSEQFWFKPRTVETEAATAEAEAVAA